LTRQVRAWSKAHAITNDPIVPVLDIVARLKELNPGGVPCCRSYSEHKEERNAYIRNWQKANPEKRRMHARPSEHRRKAILKGSSGSFTTLEWATLLKTYDNRCAYCKKRKKLTVDHVIPLSKGGTNTIGNIIPACGSCNSSKRDKLWDVQPSLKI
jgi:5-methylcytosine-specific restriction endonuclease McrA